MYSAENWAEVKRLYEREGLSKKAIAEQLNSRVGARAMAAFRVEKDYLAPLPDPLSDTDQHAGLASRRRGPAHGAGSFPRWGRLDLLNTH